MLKKSIAPICTTLSFIFAFTLTGVPHAHAEVNPSVPGAPTSLQLDSKAATSLTVSWTAPIDDGGSPITDYIVEYSADGTNWITFNDGIATTTSTTITGLTRGSAYQLRVIAVNGKGNGASTFLTFKQLPPQVKLFSAGTSHTCAILADGTVRCWGYNLHGELGDGTQTNRSSPVSVSGISSANPALSISAGDYHTCAILADGTVRCWGYNLYGELGDGTQTNRSSPVSVSGIVALTWRKVVPAEVPGFPRSLISTAKSVQSVSLEWTPPNDDGGEKISDYVIQYSSNSGTTWTTFNDPISIATSTTVTGLTAATSYIFRVAAINPEGWGTYSSVSASVTPDLVPDFPSSLSTFSKTATSLSLTWNAPFNNGGSPITDYTVEYSMDGSNWTTFIDGETSATTATVTGLTKGTAYQVRVTAVNRKGSGEASLSSSLIPAVVPTKPIELSVTGHGASSVNLSWSVPTDDGGLPISYYGIWYSTDAGDSWTWYGTTVGTETVARISLLARGYPYVFRVTATNGEGIGAPSDHSPVVIPAELPGIPTSPTLVSRGTRSATISWSAPADNGGREITGYKVRLSDNRGSTWGTPFLSTGSGTAFTIPNLPIASARSVQLATVTAEGTSEWSDSLYVTTKGARAMTVKFLDSKGIPISGGQVTWRMVDNSAWSSKVYGLTADGLIEFPYAAAGLANISLRNGVLADGTLVSGTWKTVIGYQTTTLESPRLSVLSKHLVHAVIPGGLPVANVKVTVKDEDVSRQVVVDGFTFETDSVTTSGATDPNGDFLVVGYWEETPSANIVYDDGVITQQQDVPLTLAISRVELDYMPWATFDATVINGNEGVQTSVAISVSDIDGDSMSSVINQGVRFIGPSNIRSIAKPGVKVRLVAPKGATGKCAVKGKTEKLTGTSGKNGKVVLTICPSVSGEYKLLTTGAAPIGKVLLRVKGVPAMPVTAVSVASPSVGNARISWNPPSYLGGAAITSYTVVAKASGKTTITKVVNPSTRLVTLTGLENGTTYTISIVVKTKNGTSAAVVKRLPVA